MKPSPYAGHYETAGLDEAWIQGFKAGRAEWEASIDRQAIRDTIVENDGASYSYVTDRIMALFAAVKEDTP